MSLRPCASFPLGLLPLLLASFCLLPISVARAAPAGEDPYVALLARYSAEARAQANRPEALLPLYRAWGLADRLPSLEPLALLLREISTRTSSPPEIRALARFLLADVDDSMGKADEAARERTRLGLTTRLALIGPFDNEGKHGCDTAYPPEKELDLAGRYPGKEREVSWRVLPEEATRSGSVNLSAALDPSNESVSYALALIDSPKAQTLVVHLGASGASRLFLNGTRVFSDPHYHPARFDQAQVEVPLQKGVNRLLVKVCQASGPAELYLRTSDTSGAPANVTFRTPDRLPPAPATPSPIRARVLPSLVDRLGNPTGSASLAEKAEALSFLQTFDETERTDEVTASRAARAQPRDARLQMLAAELSDDSNTRRTFLERALKADPDHAPALEALGRYQIDHGQPRRALDLLTPAVARLPQYFPLELARIAALERFDLPDQAELALAALLKRFPDRPEVVTEAARLAARRGRDDEARTLYAQAVALRADATDARRTLAQSLFDRGEVEAGLQQLRALCRLDPWNTSALAQLAEVAAANGHPDEATSAFARALAIAPDNAELHARRGKSLALEGHPDAAVAALKTSLALRPQDSDTRELLQTLQGSATPFEDAYARELSTVAQTPPRAGEDAVVLSELTATRLMPSGLTQRYAQQILRVQTARGVETERFQSIPYSPDRQELKILRARLLKTDGSILESHSESDRPLSDPSVRIYYDVRLRLLSFPSLEPGDVIELSYRLDDTASDNLLSNSFGDLQQVREREFKEAFDYYLITPSGRPLYSSAPEWLTREETTDKDGSTVLHWSSRKLARIVPEPSMPPLVEVAQPLHVSTFADWNSVGRFYWGLVRDQLAPSEALRDVVRDAKAKVPPGDEPALIRALYDFVVRKTRYVGLEFGIHGYKPYKVDTILSRRFGDCKDKASLLKALLGIAGVDSRLVLLRMSNLGALKPQPASLAIFNHAILYVPQYDLFLDGTAEYHGSHDTPALDQGAMVLIVNPDGPSELSTIPLKPAESNVAANTMRVELALDGSAQVSGTVRAGGLFAPMLRQTYDTPDTREQRFLQSWLPLYPKTELRSLDVGAIDDWEKDVTLTFALRIPRYAESRDGGLSFTPLSQIRSYVENFAPLAQRKTDLDLSFPLTKVSDYTFVLPTGLSLKPPGDVLLDSPFGRYEAHYGTTPEGVTLQSRLTLTRNRIAAGDYPAFRKFLGKIDESSRLPLRATPNRTP